MVIETGEYVRINGVIGKVEQIGCTLFWIEDGSSYSLTDKKIKHSKDITDLIEVGDVIEVHFPVRNTIRKIYVDEYFEDSMILNGVINGNVILKTILTKEQYTQNCYKIDIN